MVSKWEAGGDSIRPRPLNQAALDTSLAMATVEVKARFTRIAVGQPLEFPNFSADGSAARHLVRHPLDGKLMTLIEAGPFQPSPESRPIWLPAYYIDVQAITRAEFERFQLAVEDGLSDEESVLLFGDDLVAATLAQAYADRTSASARSRKRGTRSLGGGDGRDATMTGVSREDASAYAIWASKSLPTGHEWDRAHRGCEGVMTSGVAEWCAASSGYVRRGRSKARTGFRCSTPLGAMLALLAI
jgi:formylglycine-generating enzyme required for sulfatase activity